MLASAPLPAKTALVDLTTVFFVRQALLNASLPAASWRSWSHSIATPKICFPARLRRRLGGPALFTMPRPTLVTSAVLLLACTRNGLAQTDAHTFQAVVPENTTIPQGTISRIGLRGSTPKELTNLQAPNSISAIWTSETVKRRHSDPRGSASLPPTERTWLIARDLMGRLPCSVRHLVFECR